MYSDKPAARKCHGALNLGDFLAAARRVASVQDGQVGGFVVKIARVRVRQSMRRAVDVAAFALETHDADFRLAVEAAVALLLTLSAAGCTGACEPFERLEQRRT